MNNGNAHGKSKWFVVLLVCGIAVMSCFAGAPGPPPSESGLLENIQKLKAAEDEIVPGDNVLRRLRLAGALYALAHYYNSNKSYEKADQYYGEMFAILSNDKSERGLSSYRLYSNSTALDYMERGDLRKAKTCIDIAVSMGRENSKEKEVLPSVLTTLARWQKLMKQSDRAESTLLEAISLLGDYGFSQRIDLAKIYLETDQYAKADKTITELEKSTYADSSVMYLRAKWLRGTGKISEADKLDEKARSKEVEEIEHQKACQ